MGEPFKNQISREYVSGIAQRFQWCHESVDADKFIRIACEDLEDLELKDRSLQIVRAMEATFPEDFEAAAAIVFKSMDGDEATDIAPVASWGIMALQEFVGRNGLQYFETSMALLKAMTCKLTAEFGIRYFLDVFPLETLRTMQSWVMDSNEHVRRLVSEGTRSRLPWGMRLNRFVIDPSPVVPLLEVLKDDPSEYVRRSVANNLNDISKDHPDIACKIATYWWQGADENRKKLIKHGLRTLIKQGHSEALELLGFGEPNIEFVHFEPSVASIKMGGDLHFCAELKSSSSEVQTLVIDYIMYFQKANGGTGKKVFKWKQLELPPGKVVCFKKKHSFAKVTVRKYYPGTHKAEIQINGKVFAQCELEVVGV